MKTIVLATPYSRNDDIESIVSGTLHEYRIIRITNSEELTSSNLSEINPDWIFFPHWSWVVPHDVFDSFRCVIFHMTDLPYGRGGSPLQNLIVRGHKETQLSALRCVKELDAGPIYAKRALGLEGTAEEILRRASSLIQEMIVWIVKNEPEPVDQSGEVVEFKRRCPKDGDMAKLMNLEKAYDYIRMLDADGYPNAFINTPHLVFEFSRAELKSECVEARVRIKRRDND